MSNLAVMERRETDDGASNLPASMAQTQSLAVQLEMASLNQAITTARAFPRSIEKVARAVYSLVTLDEETAKECIYALPRGGKAIRGPSVRLAEIVASQWGNCDVASRTVHTDRIEKYVESEGIFHDLETGLRRVARTRRSIADKNGKIYNQDMVIMTANAAASIALREAILKGIPKAIWRQAYVAAEKVIAGDTKTLVQRRDQAMKAFAAFGVTPEQIFEALDLQGMQDITIDHIVDLTAMHTGLKDGSMTVEEMFPAKAQGNGDKANDVKGRLNKLAGDQPAHDPDTGEIKEGAGDKKPAAESGKKQTPAADKKNAAPAKNTENARQAAKSAPQPPQQDEQEPAGDETSGSDAPLDRTSSSAGDNSEGDGEANADEDESDPLVIARRLGYADRKSEKMKRAPKEYGLKQKMAYGEGYDEADADLAGSNNEDA